MKCFYHSADLDGHCSGAIVKRNYPECEMLGINYGQDFPFASLAQDKKETVFMVDFCLQPFIDMIKLNSMCTLTWVDHHARGSIDEAQANGFIASGGQLIEIGKAGCELAWEYFYSKESIPLAVHLLGRYDVWDHNDDRTLPFQYGMRQFNDTRPDNHELWTNVFKGGEFINKVLNDGKLLLHYELTQNEKFCRAYAFETEINGLKAICANRGFTNSKLFAYIYTTDKYDLMITFVRLKLPAQKWTVSLYSTKENVDCGVIAKQFGGGGHKGAAGFQCEDLPFNY